MRPSLALILAFAIGVAGSILVYLAFTNYISLETRIVPVEFEAVEPTRIGFDLNTSLLEFGKVPQGGVAQRTTTLSSSERARVRFAYSKSVSPYLLAMPQRLMLEPGIVQNVTFTLTLPDDISQGNYSGTVVITYERPLPWQQS